MNKFMEFFNVSINLYKYSINEKSYRKEHYYEQPYSQHLLNVALVDFENNKQHAIWLKDVESGLECYVCAKCYLRVFHNYHALNNHESSCDGKRIQKKIVLSNIKRLIHPNILNNLMLKYLTL
jgi:hypothetical protein